MYLNWVKVDFVQAWHIWDESMTVIHCFVRHQGPGLQDPLPDAGRGVREEPVVYLSCCEYRKSTATGVQILYN